MTASFDTTIIAPQTSVPPLRLQQRDYPARELSKGDILYRTGDPAEAVYRIEEGLLKLSIDLLTGKERIISVAGPGDYVGAISPLHSTYGDSAEMLSPRVRVRAIPRDEIEDELKDEVFKAAGLQILRLRETLEDSELPVPARLARIMLRLGERFGHSTDDQQVHLTLPLTHENIAAMVGAARETTTATLGEMRAQGLLQGTRGRYSFNATEMSDYVVAASF